MQDPRHHAPPPDPELARLAMQGQQRRAALESEALGQQQDAADVHLWTALGAYRGSTVKRILLALMLLMGLTAGVCVVLSALGHSDLDGMFLVPAVIGIVILTVNTFVPPLASRASVNAEQRWVKGLPFALEGYFEVLSAAPSSSRTIRYEIVWEPGTRPPDSDLVHGVFSAVSPTAIVEHADAHAVQVSGGAISGATGMSSHRVPVYRNHRLPAHVHAVVDQALVPFHRSHPIARVLLLG